MPRTKTADILMWVGAVHYPTVNSFVLEAEDLGVSKRVPTVPDGVKLGKSLLFLAHDEAARVPCKECRGSGAAKGKLNIELVKKSGRKWLPVIRPAKPRPKGIRQLVAKASTFRDLRDKTYRESDRKHKWRVVQDQELCKECAGRGEVPDGRVFGFCIIDRLELIFDCAAAAKEYSVREPDSFNGVAVTHVPGIETEPERGCGYRVIGGYYLVSQGEDAEKDARDIAEKLGEGFEARGPMVIFPEPISFGGARFRGPKVINKDDILKAALRKKPKPKRKAKRRAK